jgi:general secretion pathway protein B
VSYILDALRKAERDRQVSRVPTLATAHAGAESGRRSPWVWAVAGGLALSAVVVYSFFWASGRPERVREAALPLVAAPGPPAPAVSADAREPSPPLARAPERDEPAPAPAPGRVVERAPAARAPERPRAAPLAPPAKGRRAARPVEGRSPAPSTASPSDAPETRQVAVAQPSPTPPPGAPGKDPVTEARPAGDPAAPPAAVLAPAPSPDSGAGRALPRLTLDVLVYSDIPAERLVFINGRKYVEGQMLDGDAVVEQITPEGATLRYQGKQFVLRPKLNPYARPGSP